MIILAIDSANFFLSIALLHKEKIIGYSENKAFQGGDSVLLPMIETLLSQCNLSVKNLTHITVTLGPGSFTGTRVGIAVARGLALCLNTPILPINSFEWVAHSYKELNPSKLPLLVALESKRAESFVTLFSSDLKILRKATYLRPEELKGYIGNHNPIIIGNAAYAFTSEDTSWMPTAKELALYVQRKLADNLSFEECIPFYLRPPEITSAI
jgi:tRNA threonylcarbamoyladenosine biosynthesis protein TsaB